MSTSLTPKEKTTHSTSTPALSSISSPLPTLVIQFLNKKVKSITKKASEPSNIKKSYTQASEANILPNVKDVLYIKEAFLFLSANEVEKTIKTKNCSEGQKKHRINMMTRGPS